MDQHSACGACSFAKFSAEQATKRNYIIINKYKQSEKAPKVNIKNKDNNISHGTLMANLIGNHLLDDNGIVIGIAPNAKIYDFDISNLKEEYYFSNIMEVFDFILINNIKLDVIHDYLLS